MPQLPFAILRRRLANEIQKCARQLPHKIEVTDPTISQFPLRLSVTLVDSPGPVLDNDRIRSRFTHHCDLYISRDYPYEKPRVVWRTPIFHPNITMPEDGGYFCSGLLDDIGFNFDLYHFIRAVESLISNPNPYSPWDTVSCLKASLYFHEHPYEPPA